MNVTDAVPVRPSPLLVLVTATLLVGVSLGVLRPAEAQDVQAAFEGATIISRDVVVEPGDTVLSIARRELGSAAFARPLAEFNGLEPGGALVPGAVVRVPIQVPARGETASVAFVKGEVTRAGAPLGADALITEGDIIVTGADGFVSIAFSSGSVVNLQPNSNATIVRLSCLESDDSCLIEIATDGGELESDVEVREAQPVDFRISTPFASAAVRGTRFEVDAEAAALRTSVLEGGVGVEAEGVVVELPSGFGSVTREGEPPGEPRELLREPVFRTIPTRAAVGDAINWFALENAIAYSARFALDATLVQTVEETTIDGSRLEVDAGLASGDYYVALRGIDEIGLHGRPATVRLTIADIDPGVAPVTTAVRRDGNDFLVEIVDPAEGAPGFEIQASTTPEFDDPLSLDVVGDDAAVLRLDADTLYTRARTLIDPFTVSAFGPATSSDD